MLVLTLTEAELHQHWGNSRYKRAANYLASRKVAQRTAYRNGVITGRWDGRDLEIIVWDEAGDSEYDCLCNAAQPCDHSATLALAWVRQPETFTRVAQDYNIETFGLEEGDEDEGEDEDEMGAASLLNALISNVLRPAMGVDTQGPFNLSARGGLRPAPVVERLSTTLTLEQPHLRQSYLNLLRRLTVPQLRELAARRGVSLTGNKRDPILEALATALGHPQALAEVWPTLSAPARLILGLVPFLLTQSGVAQEQIKQVLQSFDSKATPQLQTALDELSALGLLLENEYGWLAYAQDLIYALPPDAEFARPLAPEAARSLREVFALAPTTFAHFALRVLLALKSDGARLQSRPAPPAHPLQKQIPELNAWPLASAELEALARERSPRNAFYAKAFTLLPTPLLLTDDSHTALARTLNTSSEQLDFALRLLVKLGLVVFKPGHPPVVLEAGFLQYISQHPFEHMSPLFNAWANLRDWLEFDLPQVRRAGLQLKRRGLYGDNHAQVLGTLSGARTFLMHQLRRAPQGQWIDLRTFIARARALNLLQALWPLPPGLTVEREGRALNLTQPEDWQAFYAPLVEATLAGPLHWQGVVDLAYRKDQLVAFRLTQLGAFLMYQTEKYTPPFIEVVGHALTYPATGGLSLQPLAADPALLSLLSLVGEIRNGPRGELHYQITAASAARAFEAGWDAERILAALEKAAGAPPPATIAQPLRQWWAHFGEVHLYSDVALIELADDYALAELLAATSLSQYLLYRFTPRLIALRPEGVETLREEMVSKGYTPKIEL